MGNISPNTSPPYGTSCLLTERERLGHITINIDGNIKTTELGLKASIIKFSLLRGDRAMWDRYNSGEFNGLFTKYDLNAIEGKKNDKYGGQ